MSGYLHFNDAGNNKIGAIAESLNNAGSAFHHTRSWNEELDWNDNKSFHETIQEALDNAAAEIESLKAQLAECRDKALEEAATVVDGGGKYIGMECDPDITSKAIRSLKETL